MKLHVVLANLAGDELCRMDVPANTRAAQLKDSLARELGMYPYTFRLITTNGATLEGNGLAKDIAEHGQVDLTMVKIDGIPQPDSKGYVRLQTGPESAAISAPGHFRRWPLAFPLSGVLVMLSMLFLLKRQRSRLSKPLWKFRRQRRFFGIIAYVLYLLEALFLNRAAKGLKMLKHTEGILDYIEKIKACRPVPEIRAQCYHMETRTSIIVDEDGDIHTESYEIRVDTATFVEALQVSRWEDVTGDVAYGLRYFPMLQVHFKLSWEVADRTTTQQHEEQRTALRIRAQAADDQYDMRELLRLVDDDGEECVFRSDMIGTTGGFAPRWLGFIPYLICTVFGLSWPYRYCLAQQAVKGVVVFRKKVWSTDSTAHVTAGSQTVSVQSRDDTDSTSQE